MKMVCASQRTHARDVTVISFAAHIRGFDPMTQRDGVEAQRDEITASFPPSISVQIATSNRVELRFRAFLLRHFRIRSSGVNRRQFRQPSRPFTTHPRCARRRNVAARPIAHCCGERYKFPQRDAYYPRV